MSDGRHDRLRAARLSTGLSQAALAEHLGVRSHTVYRYEKQELMPSVDVLLAIAQRCGTTVDWLLTGRGEPPSPPAETQSEESGTVAPESTVTTTCGGETPAGDESANEAPLAAAG